MVTGWTAIIINYNGAGFIESCITALEACSVRPAEILVVDNASSDDSLLELYGFPRAQVLAQERNLGFAGGANAGLAATETEVAVLFNPDVEVDPTFGAELVGLFNANPKLGAAGPLLIYPDGDTIQHAGGRIELPGCTTSHLHYGASHSSAQLLARDVEFVTGGAMALRMDAVRDISGFDERFSPVYYEDVDLCVRMAAAGWNVRFHPELRALHHEGVTLKREPTYYHYLHRNRIQFALKHLSSDVWSDSFVPAEFERLRFELTRFDEPNLMTVSGANAIEGLLRSPEQWDTAGLLDPGVYEAVASAVEEANATWEVVGSATASGNPLARLIARIVNSLGPRQYVDSVMSDQRAFNAAVVRALKAQQRLQREQLATSLILAVDLLARLRAMDESQAPTDGFESGPV